jgi:hypothetical protein
MKGLKYKQGMQLLTSLQQQETVERKLLSRIFTFASPWVLLNSEF